MGEKAVGGGSPSIEHVHRDVTGGPLRPAVFGAMDGLVSNFALVAGVAGGSTVVGGGREPILLAGLAGLAAGAFSMAVGEYTSVASQSELAQAEIEKERRELERSPAEEERELALIYVGRGLDADLARTVASQLSRDPEQALEVHAREELGIDPYDLPSPSLAAGSSFVSFAVGAALPVLPYLFDATAWLPYALVITLSALFLLGAAVGRLTGRAWWYSGVRQLLLGGAAGALTYGVGSAVGSALG